MQRHLRNFGSACLIFVVTFVGIFFWQVHRNAPGDAVVRMQVDWPSRAAAPPQQQAVAAAPPSTVADDPGQGGASSATSLAHRELDPPALPPPDPAAEIRSLSDTALFDDSRLRRLVAINNLADRAEKGDDSGEAGAALLYNAGNADPAIAARARAIYLRLHPQP